MSELAREGLSYVFSSAFFPVFGSIRQVRHLAVVAVRVGLHVVLGLLLCVVELPVCVRLDLSVLPRKKRVSRDGLYREKMRNASWKS